MAIENIGNMISRAGKAAGATCLVGIILTVSACGVSEEGNSPSAQPTSISTEAKPTETGKNDTSSVNPSDPNSLPTKTEIANDGKGNYIQTTINPDDPAFTYNPAIVDPAVLEAYSEAEVTDFQKFVVKFIAEETIDSILNNNPGDPATQETWWANNKDKIEPSNLEELHNDVKANDPNKPIVFRGQLRGSKYSLVNGDTVTHVHSRKITPVSIKSGYQNGQQLIALQADVEFTLNATFNGHTTLEATNGKVSYTATKGSNGAWLFTGYYSNFTTTPVA